MASPRGILLVALIAAFAVIHFVQADHFHDQEGFISLDCGLSPSETSPYTEPQTGLRFSSDSNFIQSGKIGRIQKSLEEEYLTQHITLRYFPDGIRNCYNLTVKKGTNYLIRARNVYGNYDGLSSYPKFDLYLGPNFWVTINMAKYAGNGTWEEIFHTPRSNSLDLCLVKTGTSTPFISAIELRPLPNNSYITTSGSLKTFNRFYFSTSKEDHQRYPNDVYDRMWKPYFASWWKQISTSFTVNTSDSFLLPQFTVTTAATPANTSAPLNHAIYLEFPTCKVFMYLHLSEVQALRANESREFDILLSGESVYDFYSPKYLQSNTVGNPSPIICEDGICNLELSKSSKSTHPPLLNALEIFTVAELPQSETDENDVVAIKKIKATYGLSRISWQGDPCVPRAFLWDGLYCSDSNTSIPPRITSLNLSSSGLTGTIAPGIQNLTHLEKLDLSNNNLTGAIPEFLAHMKSLLLINLSKNNMNGSIPQALRDREKDGLRIFVGEDEMNQCSSGSCGTKKKFPTMIIAVAASALVVIAVILVLIFVFRKKKEPSHVEATPSSKIVSRAIVTPTSISPISIETKNRKFTYLEVMEMTNNFQRALGEGGFGIVYHGYLNGSEQVAIKVLSESSSQGYKHFKAEVELLLRVHHVNLVSLVGYCDERDHLALIYEYMSNGDLKYHLSGKHSGSVLSWSTRLRVAVDAALGLEYLHIGCRPSMVHRDVKSTNILLDERFMAKIADFGLSRSCQLESHVSTVVAGTPGYLDPEYYRTGRLAEMSDVYSFGIVLLEMITNQSVIDQNREKSHITEWVAFALNRGDITKIMDPDLYGDYNSRSVWRALELAMLCACPSSEKRPSMSQVVSELKECLISENTVRRKNQDTDSQSSFELSMSFDTKAVPSAR
ncbi:PREDICTED: putative receptor-like protein kinase At3g46340 [Camelina sativa]|uniref:non-specific serine/threonine protein kinase n=1 Tax=Camelina sativa TaxID=90675 RepID=A0ABM0TG27_CAMSA|nr:PREDICTED: putative receptor-like protein kinase At3g46340 [Camelina sativa]